MDNQKDQLAGDYVDIASCIDHTTVDTFDLSAEELRFLARHYEHSNVAVLVHPPCLPHPKAYTYLPHSRCHPLRHDALKLITHMDYSLDVDDDVINIDDDDYNDDEHDVIVIDDDDDDDAMVMDEDDDDDSIHEYYQLGLGEQMPTHVSYSSVGSNDCDDVPDDDIKDDAVSSPRFCVESSRLRN